MCTGAEALLVLGGTAAAASAYTAYEGVQDAKDARKSAAAERTKAEADAVNRAQAKTQMQRKALRDNSLFTGGADAGRTTLGV